MMGNLIRRIKGKSKLKYVDNSYLSRNIEIYSSYVKLKKKYGTYIEQLARNTDKDVDETIPKKAYSLWLQGYDQAPQIVKGCIDSQRRNLPGYEYILLDENNLNQYLNLPPHIIKKWKERKISNAAFSDCVRVAALESWGGLWIDATVYLSSEIEGYLPIEKGLFVFKDLRGKEYGCSISNWFIAASKNNRYIKIMANLLERYWKDFDYPVTYLFFHVLFTIVGEYLNEEWERIETYSNIPPHILTKEIKNEFSQKRYDNICRMTPIHKLNWKKDYSTVSENSFYSKIFLSGDVK